MFSTKPLWVTPTVAIPMARGASGAWAPAAACLQGPGACWGRADGLGRGSAVQLIWTLKRKTPGPDWRCSDTFGHRDVYGEGNLNRKVEVFNDLCLSSFSLKAKKKAAGRSRSSIVSQLEVKVLLFVVNIAVTQQTLPWSWLTCCRRLQKWLFVPIWQSWERGCCQLPGREALLQPRACNTSANGPKDTASWLCQGPGRSTCAGAVFCIWLLLKCLFFLDLRVFCHLRYFIHHLAIAAQKGRTISKCFISETWA